MWIKAGKIVLGLFWIAVLGALWDRGEALWQVVLLWIGGFVLAIHWIEVAVFSRRMASVLPDRKYHQLMILLFGVLHWKTLAHRKAGRAG